MTENKGLIQRLKDRYEVSVKERADKAEKERPLRERMDSIFSAPRFITTDFWCVVCKRDCTGTGYRQVCTVRATAPTAWFMGFCPKGHKMIRRITDKDKDPYYEQSMVVARQRYELADALLTPDDPRFKVLYPKQYEELMKAYEKTSRKK
jgi:hypothetical protein